MSRRIVRHQKFNKYEKKEIRAHNVAQALHGEGIYLFENRTNADLTLPRPTKSGIKMVRAKQQFHGDSYYLDLMRSGFLKLVKVIQQNEAKVEDEKLILDQPDVITEQGKV